MKPIHRAIAICGVTQSGFAKLITENLPVAPDTPVTSQQVWNWLHRDNIVPAKYCPTIEKICGGAIVCEELNPEADWAYLRAVVAKHETAV
jgi:DNA-binding transcriptional regulator YdaS (Cro superfamily)